MDQELKKKLARDPDGLQTYEYLANHIGTCDADMGEIVDNMIATDSTGQFMVSAARYLHAIDPERYRIHINRLVSTAIDRDHERRYIADLLPSLWGSDYMERHGTLSIADDNFRRIFKRVHPQNAI